MIDEKAKELGRMIGQSAEYQAVKRANEALNEDKEAVALLQQMEKLRGDVRMARREFRKAWSRWQNGVEELGQRGPSGAVALGA